MTQNIRPPRGDRTKKNNQFFNDLEERLDAIEAGAVPDTGVTPGSYTNSDITVGADGRITAAADGVGGDGIEFSTTADGLIQVVMTEDGGSTFVGYDDLGLVSSLQDVDCSGGTGAASPNAHWTRVSGPDPGASATLTLDLPAISVFGAVDQTKVISAGSTVDASHVVNVDLTNIRNGDGSALGSLQFTAADQYVVLRLFNMTEWRVIKVSGATIDPLKPEAGGLSHQLLNDLKVTQGTNPLDVDIAQGWLNSQIGVSILAGGTTLTMTDDSANYVEIDVNGDASSNTVEFTAGSIALAFVTASSGALTIEGSDRRGFLFVPGPPVTQGAVATAQFDKTNDTTLANIPGLSVDVLAGETYTFDAVLFTVSNIGTGVKAAIAGTATATSIIYEGTTYSAGVSVATAATRATALGTAVGGVTAVTVARIEITGTIVVDDAGTLTVQFAENAAIAATVSSVLVGSKFTVTRVT